MNNTIPISTSLASTSLNASDTSDTSDISTIAEVFFSFNALLKIYHWQTKSYSRHKSIDAFNEKFESNIDSFMEILQGSRNARLTFSDPSSVSVQLENVNDDRAVELLQMLKRWLVNLLPNLLLPSETDLITIRDNMLGDVNQTLYLFTFE